MAMKQAGRQFFVALLMAALATGGSPARADESWLEGWEFTAALYGWLPEIDVSTQRGDRRSTTEISMGDLLDLVGDHFSVIAAGGHFEARRDRYILFVDAFGGYLDTDKSGRVETPQGALDKEAKVRLSQVFLEYGVGYRFGRFRMAGRERPLTVDVLAGGRWYYNDINFRVSVSNGAIGTVGGRASSKLDWTDPFIGGRWAIPLLDNLTLHFRGDIGGFDVGSHLAWNLLGGLRYFLPWRPGSTQPWVDASYKAIDFEYDGSGSDEFDMNYRGPLLGLGVTF
jgi:hypothetical protein